MVSVIIPTFNRANTIKKSIESVLNQGDLIKEIIIIDDNSTDETKDIIDKIDSDKIKYFKSDKNIGACQARNKGIELSSAKYIAFHDSDDIWYPNKIEKQMKYLKYNFDIVCCGYNQNLDGNINYIGLKDENINIHDKLLDENFIGTPTIIGKAKCFKDELFDKTLPRFQDWELMIRLTKKYKVKFINEALVEAYVQENSITRNNLSAIKAFEIILSKNYEEIKEKEYLLEKYYRRMGVFALNSELDYQKYFAEAYKSNKSKKSIIDYILSTLKMKSVLKSIHKF